MNINITTHPTGRSPENKWYFGSRTEALDLTRPKYNRIGKEEDFWDLHWKEKRAIIRRHIQIRRINT